MIVPVEILEKLKCSNCENLLSCGPVHLKQDGSNICGRCSNLEEPAVLNQPYNELAELCAFPCKYEAEGCYEKLPFSSVKQHEADCEFRTYICPVAPSGSCEWIGCRNKILQHTQGAHPKQVLQHPCEMKHDVKTASVKTFLTSVFDALFLLHVKVCLATHTIYHSVRKIGEIHDKYIFKYELNVENKNGHVMRKGEVAAQGCLALQEDTSLGMKINSLMEVLSGYDTTFTITIKEYMKCYLCKEIKNVNEIEICDKMNHIFCCKSCSSTLNSCKNIALGCTWRGQTSRHEDFLCTYSRQCNICEVQIRELNMLDHLRNKKHNSKDIKHIFKKYWYIQHTEKEKQYLTFSFKNVTYFFIYYRYGSGNNTEFFLQCIENDTKIKCVLKLKNPKTKHTSHFIMSKGYNSFCGQFYHNIFLSDEKIQAFISNDKFKVDVDIYCYQ